MLRTMQNFALLLLMLTMSKAIQLFKKTPIISTALGNGLEVFYKLENLQFSGSFKDRGISHMIQTLNGKSSISRLICSSGGNAGHAVAVAGQRLGIPVDVFVPTTTLPMMIAKLRYANANVNVGGANWNEADHLARTTLVKNPNAQYIPPFDDPLIWEGNSFLIDELIEQMDGPPNVVIASVGGGGLLRGLQLGLERHQCFNTKILAVETTGAASFAAAKAAGKVVKLDKIDTVATTLGALAVTSSVLESRIETESVVVSDQQAVKACLDYADRYRQLVEPSCGAALALVSDESLRRQNFTNDNKQKKKVAIIVCGGSAVSLELLQTWRTKYCMP